MPFKKKQSSSLLPMVSIIIVNYNYAQYISDAIKSALDQDYPAVEVLVVDDGSSDDSIRVITALEQDGVKLYTKANGGPSSARNYGVHKAKGEYVVFLDADDMLDRTYVSKTTKAIAGGVKILDLYIHRSNTLDQKIRSRNIHSTTLTG